MQPITGLHIGSLIDQDLFDVRLHHEDWHGPLNPVDCTGFDLVFLTGLQVDFDRMRQLSFYFRASGATVIAGGSICTAFPEFSSQFFDAVCAGGVDSVSLVVSDFLNGSLKSIYHSIGTKISSYPVDYRLLTKSGINPSVHLIEASRGCSFKCTFCVIPTEIGGHATYDIRAISQAIDSAISTTPYFSFRRWYPILMLHDNNFSDDREHMLKVCEVIRAHPKVRGWAALVTQNILHDRELIRHLAASKCIGLFAGLESFDPKLLRVYKKTQNLSRRYNVIDDVAYAESQGISITYGYLFDPRRQTATEIERQIKAVAQNPLIPMPVYLSAVAPLAGTPNFWDELLSGGLATNLRLRDLDGETICYADLADEPKALVSILEKLFRRPWSVVGRVPILIKTLRRIARARSLNPIRWYVIAAANLHSFVWSRGTPAQPRTYMAGTDTLDPQYFERPADLSECDRKLYFDPIRLTDPAGNPADWLKLYVARFLDEKDKGGSRRMAQGVIGSIG